MTYASAGSVALASGGIVDMNFVASPECVADLVRFDGVGTTSGNVDLDGGGIDFAWNRYFTYAYANFGNGMTPVEDGATPAVIPQGRTAATRFKNYESNYSWPNEKSQFFAFRLDSGYAWVKLDLSWDPNQLVYEGAYDTAATSPIQVGAIPEPSSFALLGLLATGAAGVMAWKRCRRKQQQGDGVEE